MKKFIITAIFISTWARVIPCPGNYAATCMNIDGKNYKINSVMKVKKIPVNIWKNETGEIEEIKIDWTRGK